MKSELSERIVELMEQAHLSPRGLSLAAGLGPTAIRDILNGKSSKPRLSTLRRIAEALGVNIRDLVPPDQLQAAMQEYGYDQITSIWQGKVSPSATLFKGANLERANMRQGDFTGSDFSKANLSYADFTYAKLKGSVFIEANLTNTNFYGADLSEVDFTGAVLDGTILIGANLSGAKLGKADLRRAVANGEAPDDGG